MELTDLRVVVTRQPGKAATLTGALEERGARVIELPTITIEPPESWTEVDSSIRSLFAGEFEWVAFTSANAVERYFSRLGCMPGEVFTKTKVAAVGTSTRAALEEGGISVDLVPDNYTAAALAQALGPGAGKVLLPRAAEVPPDMERELTAGGWTPHHVTTYRTVPARAEGETAEAVGRGEFDVVTFTSASTARGFAGMFDPLPLTGKKVACIGPVTTAACRELGITVDIEAEEHTIDGLVHALTMAT